MDRRRTHRFRRPRLVVAAAVCGAFAAGALFAAGARTAPQRAAAAATRTDLAAGLPSFVRGYRLALTRAVIPAGASFPPHRHPGMQAAYVQSGTLEYTVYRGVVKVYRGAADGSERLVRTIRKGETGSIAPGQWIVETPGLWHEGGNKGTKPVVILLASLLKRNAAAAIPVKP
jgi:quercetin dioxygenase-like cupin family protein